MNKNNFIIDQKKLRYCTQDFSVYLNPFNIKMILKVFKRKYLKLLSEIIFVNDRAIFNKIKYKIFTSIRPKVEEKKSASINFVSWIKFSVDTIS